MRPFTALSLLALPLALAEQAVLSSPKRDLVYIQAKHSKEDQHWKDLNQTWYYNYNAEPSNWLDHDGLQFVPMLRGNAEEDNNFYTIVKKLMDDGSNISHVLGFHRSGACENGQGGSCIDAKTAAQTWIQQIEPLKRLGVKLGAPAITSTEDGFQWLSDFFTQCAGECSPDFIPVHFHGEFQAFASHIGRVHATYSNMSLWVTEYGYPDQDIGTSQDLNHRASVFLEQQSFVTHYTPTGSFHSSGSEVMDPIPAMLTQAGDPTDIRTWYLGDAAVAVGNAPQSSDAAQIAGVAGWAFLVLGVSFWLLG